MRPSRFTATAVALHWIAALLIIGNLAFGLYMVDLPLSPAKLRYYSWHKWTGVTIFLALRRPSPVAPRASLLPRCPCRCPSGSARRPTRRTTCSTCSSSPLPLTGWLFSSAAGFQTVYFGVVPIPDLLSKSKALADVLKLVHVSITYRLGALVVLHAAAALKHHVVDGTTCSPACFPSSSPGRDR